MRIGCYLFHGVTNGVFQLQLLLLQSETYKYILQHSAEFLWKLYIHCVFYFNGFLTVHHGVDLNLSPT
jgi:hypothetical protein